MLTPNFLSFFQGSKHTVTQQAEERRDCDDNGGGYDVKESNVGNSSCTPGGTHKSNSNQENCTNDSTVNESADTREQQLDIGVSDNAQQLPRHAADPDIALDKNRPLVSPAQQMEHLWLMLRENGLNWFAFVAELRILLHNYSEETMTYILTDLSDHLENMDLTGEEKGKVEFSRKAYLEHERQRTVRDETTLIDNESDNLDDWLTEDIKEQVKKQRELQKRKCKSIFFARKAEQRLLKRKVPKAVSKVVQKSPNIGRDIEEFLRLRKVGADAWRRTGVLTFDGNAKTGPKVTYKRIGLATKIRVFFGIFRA